MKLEPRTTPTVLILLLLAMPAGALAQDPADAGVEPDETAEPDLEGDGGIRDEDPMGEAQTDAGPTEPEAEPASPAVEEAPVTPPPRRRGREEAGAHPGEHPRDRDLRRRVRGGQRHRQRGHLRGRRRLLELPQHPLRAGGQQVLRQRHPAGHEPLPERAGPGELRRVRLGHRGPAATPPSTTATTSGWSASTARRTWASSSSPWATATSTSAGASPCPSSSSTTRARTTPCAAAGWSTGCPAGSSWCSWAAW